MTTTTFISVPDPGESLNVAGKMNPIWYSFLESITSSANNALNSINNFAVIAAYVFKFPENETVTVMLDCNFAWTITDVVLESEVGTATVQLVVNGANVNDPILAGTGRVVQGITGGDVASGNDIALTFSSVSADIENLSVSLRGIRTF